MLIAVQYAIMLPIMFYLTRAEHDATGSYREIRRKNKNRLCSMTCGIDNILE